MSKKKLFRFAEYKAMPHTFEAQDKHLKGNWGKSIFKNNHPIFLELACGGGEYTVGLAERNPETNFIGVDIKGSRLWKGGKASLEKELNNVAFLRIQIDHLEDYFSQNEISGIWITFPDPQPHKSKKRLTSDKFLAIYRNICKPDSRLHLQTDSDLLSKFTKEIIEEQKLKLIRDFDNIYSLPEVPEELQIQTFYEKIWLKEKKTIKFLESNLFP